ncbi:hypothetical protein [Paenibacillus polymyxa]|uniref:hypothetical protein n=1 Tax=Paenibacillus polymyxa TaxID=1406 RepID=UPI001586E59D|nr:hypothetical protein [Paenibacillus polymyxa]
MSDNLHKKRMEVILSKEPEFLAQMLAYISGAMGEDLIFHGSFEDALENVDYIKWG